MFNPGDVVRSRYRLVKMTVEKKLDGQIFSCTWFDGEGRLHRSAFHADALLLDDHTEVEEGGEENG
jgi:uncharacterized protein YodC (DUF2158 family)